MSRACCRWPDLKSSEYLAVNPIGAVPALQDGDVTMSESGAITQWLAEKYGKGRLTVATGTPEQALYLQVRLCWS